MSFFLGAVCEPQCFGPTWAMGDSSGPPPHALRLGQANVDSVQPADCQVSSDAVVRSLLRLMLPRARVACATADPAALRLSALHARTPTQAALVPFRPPVLSSLRSRRRAAASMGH